MLDRRSIIKGIAGGMAISSAPVLLPQWARAEGLPTGADESAVMEALPGKKPLIKRAYRPPNFETPVGMYKDVITPNDEFFVRWHLSNIPQVNARDWKLRIEGDSVDKPYELTLDQLRKDFEQVELVAVCQCSGNRRGLSDPHVPGVEWGYGAMGNAVWKGVRLKDVLAKAGVKAGALEVIFNGADHPPLDKTPDFIKSLPMWKALDENTLIAFEMNGEALPHWNGYPARVIVPGWTATYWMKQVVSIKVSSTPETNFWMSTAYRIPKGKFPVIDRFISQEAEANTPITEMVVNSLIVTPQAGQRLRPGETMTARGLAWDGGYGIREVEVSVDGGRVWYEAALEADRGRYSFRAWNFAFTPKEKGRYVLMARATNKQGATQTRELVFNPAGYHNNVMQQIAIDVA